MIVAELLLFEAQDPRSIRRTYQVIQEAECVSYLFSYFVLCEELCLVYILCNGVDHVVHRFEILAECVGGTCLIIASVLRMIWEAISSTSTWINDVQYLLDYHFASGTKLGRDAKSLCQPCMIEVADVKTLMVRHEYKSYTLEVRESSKSLWRLLAVANRYEFEPKRGELEDTCGVEHVRLLVLRLEICFAVKSSEIKGSRTATGDHALVRDLDYDAEQLEKFGAELEAE
ncbi:hypothetical protein LXL04_014819 [Taraxacum kok-saghyz]